MVGGGKYNELVWDRGRERTKKKRKRRVFPSFCERKIQVFQGL